MNNKYIVYPILPQSIIKRDKCISLGNGKSLLVNSDIYNILKNSLSKYESIDPEFIKDLLVVAHGSPIATEKPHEIANVLSLNPKYGENYIQNISSFNPSTFLNYVDKLYYLKEMELYKDSIEFIKSNIISFLNCPSLFTIRGEILEDICKDLYFDDDIFSNLIVQAKQKYNNLIKSFSVMCGKEYPSSCEEVYKQSDDGLVNFWKNQYLNAEKAISYKENVIARINKKMENLDLQIQELTFNKLDSKKTFDQLDHQGHDLRFKTSFTEELRVKKLLNELDSEKERSSIFETIIANQEKVIRKNEEFIEKKTKENHKLRKQLKKLSTVGHQT